MARKPRLELEPGIAHVFARGNDKRTIFFDDEDRDRYLLLLARAVDRHDWRCLSYCLMDNHVHLLIETARPNLGEGMRRLQGAYAQGLNRKRGSSGHVFTSRYGSVRVADDAQLWAVVGYIARNPVAAGRCRTPEEFPWSSHRATIDGDAPDWLAVSRLLELLSAWGRDGRAAYADCVSAAEQP